MQTHTRGHLEAVGHAKDARNRSSRAYCIQHLHGKWWDGSQNKGTFEVTCSCPCPSPKPLTPVSSRRSCQVEQRGTGGTEVVLRMVKKAVHLHGSCIPGEGKRSTSSCTAYALHRSRVTACACAYFILSLSLSSVCQLPAPHTCSTCLTHVMVRARPSTPCLSLVTTLQTASRFAC